MSRYLRGLLPWLGALLVLACGLNRLTLGDLGTSPDTTAGPTVAPTANQRYSIRPTSASSGLGQLASYRANLIVDFDGQRSGEPISGRIESLTELRRQPEALHLYRFADTELPRANIPAGASEVFQVDDRIFYKRSAADAWLVFAAAQVTPDTLGFFAFDRLIPLPATVSEPPRLETLNDLAVEHYVFGQDDLRDIPNLVFEQAQGDLWIAVDGQYLMQYVLSATLQVVIPEPSAHLIDEGQLRVRYTLTDINADFTLTPPTEEAVASSALPATLPRLPDAEIVSIYPTLIEYTSAISAISATLFYRDQLARLDWGEENATIFNEKSQLTFSQNDQDLTLIITPAAEADRIRVLIELDRGP